VKKKSGTLHSLGLLNLVRCCSSAWDPPAISGETVPIIHHKPFRTEGRYGHESRAKPEGKEVNGMKSGKKEVLTKRARIREAKFWNMMRSAKTGRQCFS